MRLGLACLLLVTGCDLYFTDGDDDCVSAPEVSPGTLLRNPDTGQCEAFGSGGGGCDSCGNCIDIDIAPPPDWGSCFAGCESFDETSCVDQPGCRAVYDANSLTDEGPRFLECWAIAPSGPAAGSCEGLDAQQCSRHNNCSAFYDDDNGFLEYAGCRPERSQGCYSDDDCGTSAHCSVSDGECLPPPGCDPGQGCPAVCYGRCISDNDVCATVDCGPNSHCEAQCTDSACGPVCSPNVNQCAAIDCAPGFECVETCQGTDPEIPGCGICDAQCVPVGTCESVTTEAACLARGDCGAVYTGEDCTCDESGSCVCEVLEFARCQAN